MGKRITLSEQLLQTQQMLTELQARCSVAEAAYTSAQALADSRYAAVGKCKELEETLAKVTKELADAKSSRDYYSKQQDLANTELEVVHTILDVLPGALPREVPTDKYGARYTASLRLTVFAANAGKVGAA